MEMKKLQKQKGFTLVEIAIVLVIIGLLLGGVLKGQELINNAKVKSVTGDFESVSAAYYAYKDRTGNTAGDTGNDGIIDSNDAFWFHLKTEGFIAGTPGLVTADTGPTHELDGVWEARTGNTDITAAMFPTNHICAPNIEGNYALGMDNKFDDGNPTTGSMRGGVQSDAVTAQVAVAAASATATYAPASFYTVCKEL